MTTVMNHLGDIWLKDTRRKLPRAATRGVNDKRKTVLR